MSRRLHGAASANSRPIEPPGARAERVVEGGHHGRNAHLGDDPALPRCAAWIALHAEEEQLTRRWQELETFLIREHDWFRLGRRRQVAIREGAELLSIGHRLRDIQHLKSELIAALPHVRATTAQGLAAKLEVAAAHIRPEDNRDAHELVQSILHDLIEMQRLAGPS